MPAALFIPAGIYAALRERSLAAAVIVFGFFYAPVPAATIPERYTIDRHMVMLPFAALLTAYGVRCLHLPFRSPDSVRHNRWRGVRSPLATRSTR